jgi:hypothetical protein
VGDGPRCGTASTPGYSVTSQCDRSMAEQQAFSREGIVVLQALDPMGSVDQ